MTKQLSLEEFEGMEDVFVNLYNDEDPSISEKAVEHGSREHLLNLQMVLATTSVNHEYARMEFGETDDYERREELMAYMSECRNKYDEAREQLSTLNPLILEAFENELLFQKNTTMKYYHA